MVRTYGATPSEGKRGLLTMLHVKTPSTGKPFTGSFSVMTKSAEAGDLARRLEEYLQDVQAGNEVLITLGQKPIARLVPLAPTQIAGRRSICDLKPLMGEWIGERVIKSGD